MYKFKNISLIVLIIFYFAAGANHFYNPASYIRIIPLYLPFPKILNLLAGGFELLFAMMMIFKKTREVAAWGIVFMMIAFIPVHTQMVREAPFKLGESLLVTPLIAWVRLIVLQPFLMLWAWWYTDDKTFM